MSQSSSEYRQKIADLCRQQRLKAEFSEDYSLEIYTEIGVRIASIIVGDAKRNAVLCTWENNIFLTPMVSLYIQIMKRMESRMRMTGRKAERATKVRPNITIPKPKADIFAGERK